MNKQDVLNRIESEKVIALIRAEGPDSLVECAKVLAENGLTTIELTMTTPGALQMCARIAKELPHVMLGLGTVLHPDTVREAIDAGAKFIVTPALRPEVIALCREKGVAVLSGALTPTEAASAWDLGADVIKIFPAEFFGPAYIKSLKAPFPHFKLLPTGGVTPETVGAFLDAGAFATAAGSALVSAAALKKGDWATIGARAKEFKSAVARACAKS